MAGTVFLRTNRFEVKLEGITFKTTDFESLCKMDFLFPDGKVWIRPPTVGIDVMLHPRDPSMVLVLLCFGVGCVILRFRSGESLPKSVLKFLSDERIRFVGFGIPEKEDMFPFKELGLTKSKVDIGYLAARVLKDPKYKSCDLSVLARKVLRIKNMVGLTEASSFERHEQIKCAICHLFVSSVIAMTLMGFENKKRSDAPIKCSFINTLNSLPLLNEGWFKLPKAKKDDKKKPQIVESNYNLPIRPKCKKAVLGIDFDYANPEEGGSVDEYVHVRCKESDSEDDFIHVMCKEAGFEHDFFHVKDKDVGSGYDSRYVKCKDASWGDDTFHVKGKHGGLGDGSIHEENSLGDRKLERAVSTKMPLKGILKCPSSGLEGCSPSPPKSCSSPLAAKEQNTENGPNLKRANSKGFNVSFKY